MDSEDSMLERNEKRIMEETKTSSVVMTTYNGTEYVIQQLESLRSQTLAPLEVIIADDGSTDATVDVINEYISKNGLSNWYVIRNNVNKGWRRNFVEAAALAKGKYIFFCDQDDIWVKDKIQVMVSAMENNKQINVLAGRYIKFQNEIPEFEISGNEVHLVKEDNHLLFTDFPGCVYCVRRTFWEEIIQFWNGVFSHDAICWAAAKLQKSAYILERPVIYWRRHYGSTYTVTSRKLKNRETRTEWLKTAQENIECLKKISVALKLDSLATAKISKYSEFNKLRIEMLDKHKIVNSFKLIGRIDCYNKKKQLLLEIYLSFKK